MPTEVYDKLPCLEEIQHTIDFKLGSNLPNLLHYRTNAKHAELKGQVHESL